MHDRPVQARAAGWRLSDANSPYLRAHANDPVAWHQWDERAFATAREQGRPVLLSIGFAACHWCDVMHTESFSDPAVADVLNRAFVCIKVDREERPDVDATYLRACQHLIGRAGWPLNAFLTPTRVAFHAATYVPRHSDGGRDGWIDILTRITDAWGAQRHAIAIRADSVLADLRRSAPQVEPRSTEIALEMAVRRMAASRDPHDGALAPDPEVDGPRYPAPIAAQFLLDRGQTQTAADALMAMVRSGLRDHVGGGFFRYTTDRAGLRPHFEKLLSHNAAIARACLHGGSVARKPELLDAAASTLDWMLRELRDPSGGLGASLSADSGGTEGGYYLWTSGQLQALQGLGAFTDHLGISPHVSTQGGVVIPSPQLSRGRRDGILLLLRLKRESTRTPPARDQNFVAAANAAAATALIDGAQILQRPDLLQSADEILRWIETTLWNPDSGLAHHATETGTGGPGMLDDYAAFLEALVRLEETAPRHNRPRLIQDLATAMVARFWRTARSTFSFTDAASKAPLFPIESVHDTTAPGATGTAAIALLRAGALLGEHQWDDISASALTRAQEDAVTEPIAYAQILRALHLTDSGVRRVELAPDATPALLTVIDSRIRPDAVVVQNAAARAGTASVCGSDGCSLPTDSPLVLARQLGETWPVDK